MFVVHSDFRLESGIIHACLKDLIGLLELLYGEPEKWDDSVFDYQDLISGFFCNTLDACVLTGGIQQVESQ